MLSQAQFWFRRCPMKNSPRDLRRGCMACLRASFLLLCACAVLKVPAVTQQPTQSSPTQTPPANKSEQDSSGEMAVKDEAITTNGADAANFRVNVRLVLARVVVRDPSGHAIGNLHKEDFELFDNGKRQVISNFDVEHISAPTATPPSATPAAAGTSATAETPNPPITPPAFPVRYVAYLFDDVHLQFGDLAHVREASQHRIDKLSPTDRVGVFSTSGKTVLDFTDDRAGLRQTLDSLRPQPMRIKEADQCLNMSLYLADLIANKGDPEALQTTVNDYLLCIRAVSSDRIPMPASTAALAGNATEYVRGVAAQVLALGEEDSRTALQALKDTVRRMSVVPGQRTLVLVSPGFLTPDLEYDYYELIDSALRGQIIISSLDARGLYVVVPNGDVSQPVHMEAVFNTGHFTPTSHAVLDVQAASAASEILRVLANGTGGTFFQNNNDMDEGLRRLAEAPEYYYILGFAPQNLKTDGKFHTLKVSLTNHQRYDLQSRQGYYAPRHAANAAEEAKRQIENELFSSDELHDLPVALHTQFFKPSDASAKLTVIARVDVKQLHYKQAEDRSQNDLTVAFAVFDRNGNLLEANQKLVQMRWKNETLQAKLGSGITLRSSFNVKPGSYLVRIVARDSEQQGMSAENGVVEIP